MQWGNRFLSWIRVRSCDYSRVTRVQVLLPILPSNLRFLRIFGFVGVTWCGDPTFLAYPHVFLTCGPFIGFLGFFGIRQGYICVDVDRRDDYSIDSSAQPCAVRLWWRFFLNFAIFALVSDHLGNFSFYSWASLLVLPFLLHLPILFSLSPKVTSLGGFSCSPPSLVVPVFVFGDFSFCSSGAVSSSSSSCWGSRRLLLNLLGVSVQLVLEHLLFSAPCHATGGPSEVPLLADSGWLLYSCGDGFAWGWGLTCNSCPVPPLVFLFCAYAASPCAASPSGFCPPYRVDWHVCLQLAGLLLGLAWRGLAASSSSGPAAYAVFPGGGLLGLSCSACLRGYVDFAPCVRVLPLRCCLLGLQVGFPCCLFFPLEWVCFWLRCLQSLWAAKAVSAALRGSSSPSCVC